MHKSIRRAFKPVARIGERVKKKRSPDHEKLMIPKTEAARKRREKLRCKRKKDREELRKQQHAEHIERRKRASEKKRLRHLLRKKQHRLTRKQVSPVRTTRAQRLQRSARSWQKYIARRERRGKPVVARPKRIVAG